MQLVHTAGVKSAFLVCITSFIFLLPVGCGGGGGGGGGEGSSSTSNTDSSSGSNTGSSNSEVNGGFQYSTYADSNSDGDPTDNFSVDYPKTWTSIADPDLGIPGVLWAAFDENALGFQTNANVVLERTSLSLSSYKQATINNLSSLVTGFSLQSSSDYIGTNGMPGFILVYDEDSSGTTIRLEQATQFDELNGDAFILTLSTTPTSFNSFAGAFDHMISSFQLQ